MSGISISVAATETHEKAIAYFKVAEQYGYKFIMEVKEIRDRQYYKALGFESFDSYCEQAWNIKRDFMDQRIQIADSIGNEREFADTYRQLGHSKSLILARMEPERRKEVASAPQQLPDGSVKTIDEMTVRELKKLEQRAKEAEELADQLEDEKRRLEKQLKNVIPIDQFEDAVTVRMDQYQEQVEHEKEQSLKEKDRRIKELESRKPEIKEVVPANVKEEMEKLRSKAIQSDELKRKLDKAQDDLLNATRASLLQKDQFVVHDTLSTFVQSVGKHVKKLELEVIKHPGNLDIQRDVQAAIRTLENAVQEMYSWLEVPMEGVVLDGEFTVTSGS